MFKNEPEIKLFLIIFLFLILAGCGSTFKKAEIETPEAYHAERDTVRINGSNSEVDSLYFLIDRLLENQTALYNRIDSLETELNIYESIPVSARDFEIPDKYFFAGYEIDLKNNRTSERFEKIFQNELKAAYRYVPLSGRYFPHFEKVFEKYGIHDDIKYLSIAESALNPSATSHAGAAGIWQFMPGTAKGYGMIINDYIDERRDIFKSTEAAAKLLSDNYRTLLRGGIDDWLLSMCAYNAGVGNILRSAKSQGSNSFFNMIMRAEETDHYVYRSIAIKMIFEYQEQLFGRKFELMEPFEDIYREEKLTVKGFHEINDWAIAQGTTVSDVHEINPWIRIYRQSRVRYSPINKVVLPPGDYKILLPKTAARNEALIAKAEKTLLSETSSHFVYYTVKTGDNLSTIARRHGTTIAHIKLLNDLTSNIIRPGQKLKVRGDIQPKSAQFHIVKSGESLVIIAGKYGMTVGQLQSINGLRGDRILVDQRLVVSNTAGYVSPELPSEEQHHTVEEGETLSGIALKYGVTVDELRASNNLKGDMINIGQKIIVKTDHVIYTVKSGDNLSTIASRFNTTHLKIMRDNNLSSDRLAIGQKLKIYKN